MPRVRNYAVSWPILLLLIAQLLVGVMVSPLRAFFPIYVSEVLRVSPSLIAVLMALGQAVAMVTSVMGGSLSDAWGRKRILLMGWLGLSLGSLVYFAPVPWLVAILWACGSVGLSLSNLGGTGYLIDGADARRLGMLSAFYNWGFTLGGALSSPGAGLLLDVRGFGALGWALLAVSLIGGVGVLLFLPARQGGQGHISAPLAQFLGYGAVLRHPRVLILTLLRFLPTCYWGMAGVLLPLLLKRMTTRNVWVALYTTVSSVMAALAQMLVGRLVDRWGARFPTLAALVTLVVGAGGLACFARHIWGIYVFGTLAACAAWSLSTLMPSLVAITVETEMRGRVLGLLHLLWNAGMIVGATLGGTLVATAEGLPFLAGAVLNVIAVVLAWHFFWSPGK